MPKWASLFVGIVVLGWIYGITHDLITAHLFPEYFTVHHHDVGYTHPVQLAFFWGVLATWPSIIAGLALCFTSFGMNLPQLDPLWILKRAAALAAICWVVSLGLIPLNILRIHLDKEMEYYGDDRLQIAIEGGVFLAHGSSYATMGLATLILLSWTFLKRAKMDREERGLT